VRINGVAGLACKTQALPLAEKGVVVVDPLTNLPTIKDLVADFTAFWEAYDKVRPHLERQHEQHDDRLTWRDKLSAKHLDQLSRAVDCIKCAACLSDCPKRKLMPEYIGPQACVQLYKFYFDPRDAAHDFRVAEAAAPGGAVACDSYTNCVKVCPKDVRPLRAIHFIKQGLASRSK
jgi:succinate dehydrogenase / fumarate reductase iron-sulfur subunit